MRALIVSCGNLNLDVYMKVESLPERGSATESKDFYFSGGGAASNFAVAMSRLEMNVRLLACVRHDFLGEMLLQELAREGVDTSYIRRVNATTGLVVVIVDEQGERTMIAFRGANNLLSHEVVEESVLSQAVLFHVASLSGDKTLRILKKVKSINESIVTSYDPGGVAIRDRAEVLKALKYTDILLLNEREFKGIFSHYKSELLESFLSQGTRRLRIVVIKRGGRGASFLAKPFCVDVPAFKVNVVDATGAGDAFNAGFLFGYLLNLSPEETLTLANAVGALKVSRKGARSSPFLAEVLLFLRERGFKGLAEAIEARAKVLKR